LNLGAVRQMLRPWIGPAGGSGIVISQTGTHQPRSGAGRNRVSADGASAAASLFGV
jgi:hypothetical protein